MPSAHSNPTQAAQILAALRAGQSLTPLAARQLYGCDRLINSILESHMCDPEYPSTPGQSR